MAAGSRAVPRTPADRRVSLIAELTGRIRPFPAVDDCLCQFLSHHYHVQSLIVSTPCVWQRRELLMHHKDKAVLTDEVEMNVVEKNFVTVHPRWIWANW